MHKDGYKINKIEKQGGIIVYRLEYFNQNKSMWNQFDFESFEKAIQFRDNVLEQMKK